MFITNICSLAGFGLIAFSPAHVIFDKVDLYRDDCHLDAILTGGRMQYPAMDPSMNGIHDSVQASRAILNGSLFGWLWTKLGWRYVLSGLACIHEYFIPAQVPLVRVG